MSSRRTTWALIAVLCFSLTAVAASSAGPAPLVVRSASLVQSGQNLVWSLELGQPFSPGELALNRRALCLVVTPVKGKPTGPLCLAGPAPHGRNPQLVSLRRAGRSLRWQIVPASIVRTANTNLTATFAATATGAGYQPLRWQVVSEVLPPLCATINGCERLTPSVPALLALHAPQLAGCVPTGPSWVFHGPTNVREIALTFDDGPWYAPPTSRFLSVLEREHAVATFFEIGDQISSYDPHGTIERQMLRDGDMIGDHTWDHHNVARAGALARGEITAAATAIRNATGGFQPCLFRAPYGLVSPAIVAEARDMGFATIQWNVDPHDWSRPGVNAIARAVVAGAQRGSIVIEHFGGGDRNQTLAALPSEIETLRSEGYKLVTVTQLLGYRLIYR